MGLEIAIRELRDDERAWADERYRAIQFAITPPGSVALVAELLGSSGRGAGSPRGSEMTGQPRTESGPRDAARGGVNFAARPRKRGREGPLSIERAGARIGLGRLVVHEPGVVELGGIWTDEAARGAGVARAMVAALLARAEAGAGAGGRLWCIPFAHLAAFYGSFGFTAAEAPWPLPIASKVAACIAHALPDVVVLAR